MEKKTQGRNQDIYTEGDISLMYTARFLGFRLGWHGILLVLILQFPVLDSGLAAVDSRTVLDTEVLNGLPKAEIASQLPWKHMLGSQHTIWHLAVFDPFLKAYSVPQLDTSIERCDTSRCTYLAAVKPAERSIELVSYTFSWCRDRPAYLFLWCSCRSRVPLGDCSFVRPFASTSGQM
jgi:hypothetical protein